MKHAILNLALRTLKRNKKMILVCGISIVISISLLSSLFILFSTMTAEFMDKAFRRYGKEHAIIFDISNNVVDNLSDLANEIGVVSVLYQYEDKNALISDSFTVGYMDNISLNLAYINLKEGRLPSKKGEIALSEAILFSLGNYTVGDTISLDLMELDGEESFLEAQLVEFSLVGITSNFLKVDSENFRQGYEQIPQALISVDEGIARVQHLLVTMRDFSDIGRFNSFIDREDCSNIYINRNVFNEDGSVNIKSGSNQNIFLTFLILISIMGILCTCGIMYLFLLAQKNAISVLRYIGATDFNMIIYFLLQIIVLLIFSIPVGMVLGSALPFALVGSMSFIGDISINISFINLLIPVAITVLAIILILLNPMIKLLKRDSVDIKRIFVSYKGKNRNKTRRPLLLWIMRSTFSNSGIIHAIVSISVCIGVFLGGIFLTRAVIRDMESMLVSDYHISNYDGMSIGELMIPRNIFIGINQKQYDSLKNNDEISNIYALKNFPVKLCENEDYFANKYLQREKVKPLFDDGFDLIQEKIKYGYNENDNLYSIDINEVNNELFEEIKKYIIRGDADSDIILVSNESLNDIELNRQINISQVIDEKKVDLIVKIGAVANIPADNKVLQYIFYNEINFVTKDFITNNFKDFPYHELYIELNEAEDYSLIENTLTILKDQNKEMFIRSLREEAQAQRDTVNIVRLIMYSLMLITGLIGIFNIINYSYGRIRLRRRELGIFRAIGMTEDQMKKLFRIEFISVLLVSLMIGIFIATIICWYFANRATFKWHDLLPFTETVILAIGILLIGYFVFNRPIKKIFKEEISEYLRF